MWYLYVGNDSSLANFGNVCDDNDQLKYSILSLGNANCNSALCGMFGTSGLQSTNIQTTDNCVTCTKLKVLEDNVCYKVAKSCNAGQI